MMGNSLYNVCYLVDNNKKYINIMMVSMYSLLVNNHAAFNIYILYVNLTAEQMKGIQENFRDFNSRLIFVDVSDYIDRIQLETKWPAIVNVRLFMDLIIPDTVDKILYLDSDTLICGGLEALWNLDEEAYCIAAVADCMEDSRKIKIGLKPETYYINSGVVMFYLKNIRNKNYYKKMIDIIKRYRDVIRFPDQDILNCIFQGKICILPLQYNVLTPYFKLAYSFYTAYKNSSNSFYCQEDYKFAVNNPVIIHFTGSFCYSRPWGRCCEHPFAQDYWRYMEILHLDCYGRDSRTWKQRCVDFLVSVFPERVSLVILKLIRRLTIA